MKAPLVPVALIYAAGLLLGRWVEAPLAAGFLTAGSLAILALLWKVARPWLLAAAVFLFAWLNFSAATAIVSPFDLQTLASERTGLVTLRGRLKETPAQRVFVRDEQESWRSVAELELTEIRIGGDEWKPAHDRVFSATSGTLGSAFVKGQSIEVSGVLQRPPLPLADGLFDYRRYLALRGIHYELKVERVEDWSVAGDAVRQPIAVAFQRWAQELLARGLPERDEALQLQWAMVLGWKTALTDEVSEPFMRSGTMHIFAISGLHIALIAGIVLIVLRAAGVPRLGCGLVVLPLIWFYTAATGWQASAIRSAVMTSVIVAGWSLRRPANLVNSLAAAALLILVWDPRQLFQASFQLSFFVVLSIALLVPRLDKWKERWFHIDPFLPMEARSRWQRWSIRVGNALWTGFATSSAAFLGSAPLVAHYFHLFTPGSLLANLVIVPISSFALMSGLASMSIGALLPWLAEIFNHSGWFWMRLMIWLSEAASAAPGAWFYVPAPGVLIFALYYGVLFAILTGLLICKRTRWWSASAAALLGCAVVFQQFQERTWTTLTVLPLNGGHAIYCRGEGEWLIDCGDENAVDFVLKPFLQSQGVNRLDNFVLTHGDTAQIGGGEALLKTFPVRRTYASDVSFRSAKYRELLSLLDVHSTLLLSATNGSALGEWKVLHPESREPVARADDGPVVLLRELNGVRVLLLSDLAKAGQERLFARHPALKADIVIAGLPEGDEPLANELIQLIGPRLIIIADSEYPATGRAGESLRGRLRKTGIPTLFTREAGAITLRTRDGLYAVRSAR